MSGLIWLIISLTKKNRASNPSGWKIPLVVLVTGFVIGLINVSSIPFLAGLTIKIIATSLTILIGICVIFLLSNKRGASRVSIGIGQKCTNCGKTLPLFSSEGVCEDCKKKVDSESDEIKLELLSNKNLSAEQTSILKKHYRKSLLKLFDDLYEAFILDEVLDDEELNLLRNFQKEFDLTNEEVKFDERLRFHVYRNALLKEGNLPVVNLTISGSSPVILKKGELIHFAESSELSEMKTINLGYRGGSRGVSFRLMKGVSLRMGSHRGQLVKEDKLVPTSRGVFILTNQRLLLQPFPGCKAVQIPLAKLLSYNFFKNGIEIYKDGREKPYFFNLKEGSIDIVGLCLEHLLGQN